MQLSLLDSQHFVWAVYVLVDDAACVWTSFQVSNSLPQLMKSHQGGNSELHGQPANQKSIANLQQQLAVP